MIQGPPHTDHGTDLSQDDLYALARAVDRGDEDALAVFVDVLLERHEWPDAPAVKRPMLQARARERARTMRHAVGEVITLLLQRDASPGDIAILQRGTLVVSCDKTGRTYRLFQDTMLHGEEGAWADFELEGEVVSVLARPTNVTCNDASICAWSVPPIEVRGERRAPAPTITWWSAPTRNYYDRERLGETRGFRNTPLALRAKLKPWER